MQRIVFIGIGGIGLSAIAHIMLDCDIKNIIGIDGNINQDSLDILKEKGIELYEHGHITCDHDDMVIYSDAVLGSPEYLTYKALGVRMLSYFGFVGAISRYFKTISVAGSHGKSTTTAIGISALQKSSPHFALGIVGTLMKEFNGANYYINPKQKTYIQFVILYVINTANAIPEEYQPSLAGDKPIFIIEADEFNKHFHLLHTEIALITNIEHDHTDIYPSKEDYLDAFRLFIHKTKSAIISHPDTTLPIDLDEKETQQSLSITNKANHPQYRSTSHYHFNFNTIIGEHNQSNANLVLTLLEFLGIDKKQSIEYIEAFPGIRRRQELLIKTEQGGLYSDYAHHPTEIKATYDAIRSQFPNHTIIGIFQPHQAARVLEFEQEFIQSISLFDTCYIFPIYAARENFDLLGEKYPELAHSGSFHNYSKIFANKCQGQFIETFDEARDIIETHKDNAIIILMTAGNLDREIRKRIKTL